MTPSTSDLDVLLETAIDLTRVLFGRTGSVELRSFQLASRPQGAPTGPNPLWYAAATYGDERLEWAHGAKPSEALRSLVARLGRGLPEQSAALAPLLGIVREVAACAK